VLGIEGFVGALVDHYKATPESPTCSDGIEAGNTQKIIEKNRDLVLY